MSETLYRKYRPKNFSEIIGQAHIVRTLSNAIKNNRVGQAYLFTGPRGTGKTSIARILAKAVNCLDSKGAISCEKCQSCKTINEGRSLDIIEIDAASNTGVDNIRELRETVALPPTSLKFKVYIIDEVHMLSSGAFNALLKTLEEPPSHVIFILATTEIHKVPETILSRCQRFDFVRLPLPNIIEKLNFISRLEKVKVEKEALEMIAIASEGGMRDAESILAQIISLEDKNITTAEVQEILGTTDRKSIEAVAKDILENDSASAISKINSLLEEGYDLSVFTKSLINYLRQAMLLKINDSLKNYFSYEMTGEQIEKLSKISQKAELSKIIETINLLLEAQGRLSSFMLPQLPLEIAIIKATQTFPRVQEVSPEVGEKSPKIVQTSKKEVILEKIAGSKSSIQTGSISIGKVRENWNRLISETRPFNHSLNALLSNCQVVKTEGQKITIATPYEFYRERLNDPANRLTMEQVFGKILECPVEIEIVIDKSLATPSKESDELQKPKKKSEQDPLLAEALEIMGGKIVE